MTEAKLPPGLCWLSASRLLAPGSDDQPIYLRSDAGRPLILDAIYVDA